MSLEKIGESKKVPSAVKAPELAKAAEPVAAPTIVAAAAPEQPRPPLGTFRDENGEDRRPRTMAEFMTASEYGPRNICSRCGRDRGPRFHCPYCS